VLNHIDMTDFRLFIHIAESNSLRKGADLACLSAPAASARIANLEARTATRLLVRSSKGVTLTLAGQAFFHHAKLILGQVENLRGDIEAYSSTIKGHLRVAANPMAIMEFLPRLLQSYITSRPDVRLDLRELFSNEIVRWVTAGNSDIGIILGSVRTETLEVLSCWDTRLCLVTPLDHPLAGLAKTSFAEALEFEFVDFPEGSPPHGPLHEAADALGVQVRSRVRAVSFSSFCRLVEAGIGIGVSPEPAVRRVAKSMALAAVPLVDEIATLPGSLCARRFKALPAYARDFVNLMMNDSHEGGASAEGLTREDSTTSERDSV
jgi:DNA-binding transcriptional LysR family regulator